MAAARTMPSPDGPAPLAVEASSLYQFDDLASMVAASDLVVRARVDTTTRGRLVGEGEAAVVSRIDTLEIEEVLAGDATVCGSTLLVEEEGWLGDGTAIAVNGLAPSEAGMDAIWFLDRRPDPEVPGYLVINHQGRFVVDGDRLEGADGKDPLVARLEPLGPDGLTDAVRQVVGAERLGRRPMAAFVLVHGAWSGAHGFHLVRRRLWAAGHEAFTPSLTGVGERVHLTGPGVTLSTHVADVVNTVLYEDLDGIVLVGFSYGGAVVTAALPHIADRVAHLVYLDAFVPDDGDTVGQLAGGPPPGPITARRAVARPAHPPDLRRPARGGVLRAAPRRPSRRVLHRADPCASAHRGLSLLAHLRAGHRRRTGRAGHGRLRRRRHPRPDVAGLAMPRHRHEPHDRPEPPGRAGGHPARPGRQRRAVAHRETPGGPGWI